MKGDLESVLPMLALVILSVSLAGVSLPLAEGIAALASESADEIDKISQTREHADNLVHSYAPIQTEYSLNEASFEAGDGSPLEWNNSMEGGLEEIEAYWHSEIEEKIAQDLDVSTPDCNTQGLEFESDLYPGEREIDKAEINVTIKDGELTCTQEGEDTTISLDENSFNVTNNRNNFLELANESLKYSEDLEDEIDDLEELYEGEAESCEASEDELVEEAREEADEELEKELEDAMEAPESDFERSESLERVDSGLESSTSWEEESEDCECILWNCTETEETDIQENAVFLIEDKEHEVEASREGFTADSDETDGGLVDLEIEPEEDFLEVEFTHDGEPLPGVEAEIDGETRVSPGSGTVFFDAEEGSLEASRRGFHDVEVEVEESREIEMEKKEGFSQVEIEVSDGSGVPGVSFSEVEAVTDSDGEATAFVEEELEAEASRAGYSSEEAVLEPGGSAEVTLERETELEDLIVNVENGGVGTPVDAVSETDDTSGCDETKCIGWEDKKFVDVEVEAEEAEFSWSMEGEEEILGSSGYENLEYSVKEYEYIW